MRLRDTDNVEEGSVLQRAYVAIKRFVFESFGRDRWQQPERIIATLGLTDGDKVADLGSGGGYFTFRLARAVGPSGVVYAVDTDRRIQADLIRRAEREAVPNIRTIDPRQDDPALPEAVDLFFLCEAYHHLKNQTAYFAGAARYLKPGGRLAIVEWKRAGIFRFLGHATKPEVIRNDLEAAGYRLLERHEFVQRQSFLIFGRA